MNSRGGNVRSIQAHNMRIDHGVHGGRHVVTERNGRRVVGMGHGRGYSERAYYNRGGRSYYQRTYYMGGRRYAYAYRGYYYHGARYYGYAPAYYYHPAYYGWAYNPWPAPVYYNWGWAGNPWYGAYGYYYEPYPAYAAAPFWLTDYMISANLQAAYEAGLAAGAAGTASLAPEANLFAVAGVSGSADRRQPPSCLWRRALCKRSERQLANAGEQGGERMPSPTR